jgi:hypothetical protein
MAYPRASIDETRARILADPVLLAHVIGAETEWFHKLWAEWTLRHPFTLLESPRGFGKSYIATAIASIWWVLTFLKGKPAEERWQSAETPSGARKAWKYKGNPVPGRDFIGADERDIEKAGEDALDTILKSWGFS